ncbi:MAG: c-type cytochrome [Labilithrix sp.]|nr:c-type cytochrome [Labilithrix sp.]
MRKLAIVGILAAVACDKGGGAPTPSTTTAPAVASSAPAAPAPTFDPGQLAVFAPLPEKIERPDNLLTPEKVALGKTLYFDPKLSKGKDVSCNACHDVTKNGASETQRGRRNAPTIFNAAGGFAQGWDARGTLVEDFVIAHAAEPDVMSQGDKALVQAVAASPAYVAAFKKAFPDEKGAITTDTIGKALGAYTRKLLTPSRWDKFLAGDASALTDAEKAGLAAFLDANCMTCHAGKYIGAAQTQKLGVAKPWPVAPGRAEDLGRFEVTKQDVDRHVFKVPTLRNVTKTSPYLHDGSMSSLEENVKLMARHQVGKELDDARVKAIVTFLGALEGEPPKDLVTKP